jgi:hypothetical protein
MDQRCKTSAVIEAWCEQEVAVWFCLLSPGDKSDGSMWEGR